MRNFVYLLAAVFFLSLGWSAAYGYHKDSKTDATSREVQKEVLVVAQAKDTSMKTEYEKYQKKIQEELNEYKKKMKELEAKAKNLKDKAKVEANEAMGDLQKKMDVAEQKLKSMKSASGEAWEKMKAEVDSAMTSVKKSYEKVAAYFKK
jgi:ElaB/YqjD/DUF883 family membrane-anchored ribosome-binding protein